MRVALVRQGAAQTTERITVKFPSGETRIMSAGPSSILSQAVIEVFAPKFLGHPAVIFLSESGNKVVAHDDGLARKIGLNIQADKNLPDIILADLAPDQPLLVFVEVVVTDGPVTNSRKKALQELSAAAGFPPEHVAFVTAYLDRSSPSFRKNVSELAWGSYAWFASEPDNICELAAEPRRIT